MNTPEVDIKDMLVSDGIVTFKTDFFIGLLPQKPDNCAAIMTYADGGFGGVSDVGLYSPLVQVLTRGSANQDGYTGAYDQAQNIIDALHMTTGRTQGGSVYTIKRINGPSRVGNDEGGRPLWSTNFRCWRNPV